MGDRRQVVVQEGAEKVYLYTHWGGSELPETVRDAMARGRDRWTDAPYLTRIIFCQMLGGKLMETTGVGIWSSNMDSEYDDVIVNITEQKVTIGEKTCTFAKYVEKA